MSTLLGVNLVELAGILTAASVIIVFVIKIFKCIKAVVNSILDVGKRLSSVELSCMRLELCNLMRHMPHNEVGIDNLFKEYIGKGGNHYVIERYSEYKNSRKITKDVT